MFVTAPSRKVFTTLAFTAHMLGEQAGLCRRRKALPAGLKLMLEKEHQSRRNTTAANHPVMIAIIAVVMPVQQPVVLRRVGDELLEADLDDLEGRVGARQQRAVGEHFDIDVVVSDRSFGRQRNVPRETPSG